MPFRKLCKDSRVMILPYFYRSSAVLIGHALLVGAMRKSGALARFGFFVLVSEHLRSYSSAFL